MTVSNFCQINNLLNFKNCLHNLVMAFYIVFQKSDATV